MQSASASQIISSQLKIRIEELHKINKTLSDKQNLTDYLLFSTHQKKEALLRKLKEYDNELTELDTEIEGYYNELFNELKLDKNKKILTNLNTLRDLLDTKANSLNQHREMVNAKENEINEKISQLNNSQLELFNQIMSKIDNDDIENYIDTANINAEYEKMKNIYFNEIAEEIQKMQANVERRGRTRSVDDLKNRKGADRIFSYNNDHIIIHNNSLPKDFSESKRNSNVVKICKTKIPQQKPKYYASSSAQKIGYSQNLSLNVPSVKVLPNGRDDKKYTPSSSVGNIYGNKKMNSMQLSRFHSKFFSQGE